jgi:phosphoribosylanthranilate isomerase
VGPVVKVCGLTRVDDVVLAAELGAWALGFVFAPSPRRLTPAGARGLIAEAAERLARETGPAGGPGRARRPLTVGVFGDVSADEIAEVAGMVGLDAVQLHGADCRDGSAAAAVRAALLERQVGARQARPAAPGFAPGITPRVASDSVCGARPLIIQAVAVPAEGDDAAALAEAVAAVLHTAGGERGADIVLLDSKVAGRFGGTGTAFAWALVRAVADGCPVLVAGGLTPDNVATALDESGAWGVDVSSGVELSPGVKDPDKLVRLFANAPVGAALVWPGARAGAAAGSGAASLSGAAARGAHCSQEG